MTDEASEPAIDADENPLAELAPIGDTPMAPAHAIAGVALHMAMKYHDMSTVKDGSLYQQLKVEGRNIRAINLDTVFETAIRIEQHLLGSSDRIAKIVVDALTVDEAGDAEDGAKVVPTET